MASRKSTEGLTPEDIQRIYDSVYDALGDNMAERIVESVTGKDKAARGHFSFQQSRSANGRSTFTFASFETTAATLEAVAKERARRKAAAYTGPAMLGPGYRPATLEQLKIDFRAAAKVTHPDTGGTADAFRRCTSLFEAHKRARGWR